LNTILFLYKRGWNKIALTWLLWKSFSNCFKY